MTGAAPPLRAPVKLPPLLGPRPLRRSAWAAVDAAVRGELDRAQAAVRALLAALVEREPRAASLLAQLRGARAQLGGWPSGDAPEGWRQLQDREKQDLELGLKLALVAQVVVDLIAAGWTPELEGGEVYLLPPAQGPIVGDEALTAAKASVREAMQRRVRSALRSDRVGAAVAYMEPGVRALHADPQALADALERSGPDAVKPYIEPARKADGDDPHTGLERYSVFTYMRWWWSFPYNDTPGRSVPFLIRDAGQPGHPVCGLLCLASPVLRMTGRDGALGLSVPWLRAVVATLWAAVAGAPELKAASERVDGEEGLSGREIRAYVASLIRCADLEAWCRSAPAAARQAAAAGAAAALLDGLISEIEDAAELIDLSAIHVELSLPDAELAARLRERADEAEALWRRLRRANASGAVDPARVDALLAALQSGALPGGALPRDVLFVKKRHRQLARHVEAKARLVGIRGAVDPLGLLAEALGASPSRPARRGGRPAAERTADARAVGAAMEERRVRVLAAQVAEVTVCGAIPPYNHLLGGKLASLAALSRDAAAVWQAAYGGMVSEITSRMAGREVRRPAELLALSTTGFYGVGNSQYNRAVIPCGTTRVGWRHAGITAGHGTLHLSEAAVELAEALLLFKEGGRLVSAQFGEGPSERLRKLRDAMAAAGLPAGEVLQHGSPRAIFVATLGSIPPYRSREPGWATRGPAVAEVAAWWRSRWLSGRLPRAVQELRAAAPPQLLSERYPDEVAEALTAFEARGGVPDSELPEPFDLDDGIDAAEEGEE